MGNGVGQGVWRAQTLLRHTLPARRTAPQGLSRRAAAATHRHAPARLARPATQAFTPRTTNSTHGLRCASNRLLNQTRDNQLWVSDITYLPLANGDWAYLCAYQDMVSKQVIGWQVSAAMPEELIISALQRAFWVQPPTPGLLVHSDRGGQYCGKAYCKLLYDHEALRSQSRHGDYYDNAQAESLWSRLKTEVLEGRERPVFADLADAQVSIANYFDTTTMKAYTLVSAIILPITLINSFLNLMP